MIQKSVKNYLDIYLFIIIVAILILKIFYFNNQYILDNYKDKQTQFCNDLKLTPSQCVIFGIDLNNSHKEYNRGGDTNRLCFSRVWDGRIA